MTMAKMMDTPLDTWVGMLPEGEAHVWRIALRDELVAAVHALACLSAEELERLERHRSAAAGQQFALTRLALRHILARYTGTAPDAVELVVDTRGKPDLSGAGVVRFSVSHAERLALVAVARAAVGIDVERVRQPRRLLRMARRVLHADTVGALERLPVEAQRLAFLDAWTQRESHVKAVGGGIFATPDALPFCVGQPADGTPYRYRDRCDAEEWSVARFHPAADARATFVARGRVTELRYFEWSIDPARAREERCNGDSGAGTV
jgi:4'-phosphopantetheinyl transferase